MKDWNLVQIEGEEKVAVEAEEHKASGKALPTKKVEAKKPAAKSAG